MDKNLVDAIVKSLEGEATGWDFSRFEARHRPSATIIWIANGRWGMDVKFGNTPKIGGVVMFALAPWRYAVWAAVQSAISRRQQAVYAEFIAAA